MDYITIRHHLDVLLDNNDLRMAGGDYGTMYLFSDQVTANWSTVEEILETATTHNLEWWNAESPHIPYDGEGGVNVYLDGEYLLSTATSKASRR